MLQLPARGNFCGHRRRARRYRLIDLLLLLAHVTHLRIKLVLLAQRVFRLILECRLFVLEQLLIKAFQLRVQRLPLVDQHLHTLARGFGLRQIFAQRLHTREFVTHAYAVYTQLLKACSFTGEIRRSKCTFAVMELIQEAQEPLGPGIAASQGEILDLDLNTGVAAGGLRPINGFRNREIQIGQRLLTRCTLHGKHRGVGLGARLRIDVGRHAADHHGVHLTAQRFHFLLALIQCLGYRFQTVLHGQLFLLDFLLTARGLLLLLALSQLTALRQYLHLLLFQHGVFLGQRL